MEEPVVYVVQVSSDRVRVGLSSSPPHADEAHLIGEDETGKKRYFGDEARENAEYCTKLWCPVQRDEPPDWEAFEQLLEYCFDGMQHPPEKSYVVVVISSFSVNKGTFLDLRRILLDNFEFIGGTFIESSVAVGLAQNSDCITVEMEDYFTRITRIAGNGVDYTGQIPIGSQTVSEHLRRLLAARGVSLLGVEDYDTVERIKLEMCYCALNFEEEIERSSFLHPEEPDFLPELGKLLTKERILAPEVLFNPSMMGFDLDLGIDTFIEKVGTGFGHPVLLIGKGFSISKVCDRIRKLFNDDLEIKLDAEGIGGYNGAVVYINACLRSAGANGVGGWSMSWPLSRIRNRGW